MDTYKLYKKNGLCEQVLLSVSLNNVFCAIQCAFHFCRSMSTVYGTYNLGKMQI